jgi:hypothetical protein
MPLWQSSLEVRLLPLGGRVFRLEVRAYADDTAREVIVYVCAQRADGVAVLPVVVGAPNFDAVGVVDLRPPSGLYVLRGLATLLHPSGSWEAAAAAAAPALDVYLLHLEVEAPVDATVLSAQAFSATPSPEMAKAYAEVALP